MTNKYRLGAIGALTDEYEKALNELKTILQNISNDNFCLITDESIEDDFKSIRNITLHIVSSGYVYANHIRNRFDNDIVLNQVKIDNINEAIEELDKMFLYTVQTFEDKWLLTDDELMNTIIKTSWTTYDLEAIIEHSIVHILRHRLQIEKRLNTRKLALNSGYEMYWDRDLNKNWEDKIIDKTNLFEINKDTNIDQLIIKCDLKLPESNFKIFIKYILHALNIWP